MKIHQILLHPFYWISLIVLLTNDFILKSVMPGFVSGKLSDFAGLIILSLFIFALHPQLFQKKKNKILLLAASGAVLIVLQFPQVLVLLDYNLSLLGLPPHNLTPDLTDLTALIILPLVYLFMNRVELMSRVKVITCKKRLQHMLPILIGTCSFFALSATSFIGSKTITVNEEISSAKHFDEILFLIQEKMAEDQIEVQSTYIQNDSTISMSLLFYDDIWYTDKNGWKSRWKEEISGQMVFNINEEANYVELTEISFSVFNSDIDTSAMRIFENRLKPLIEDAGK